MKLCDIRRISQILKTVDPSILLAVDNTFMSSYFQKPLDLGADLSVQSLTKYINGHSDVVMGSVLTNSNDLYKKLKYYQNALGAIPSPFDCYLVKRGLKTLELRMKTHQTNAIKVANYLESSKKVSKVLHPSLQSHPQRDIALRQCSGFSGMVSFYLTGGQSEANKFVRSLKLFKLAVSLGGIQSLVEIPHVMSHASVSREHCAKLGVTDNLIRLSVGIENTKDLINDLKHAFNAI
jgi:cystathionine gamma-lyase